MCRRRVNQRKGWRIKKGETNRQQYEKRKQIIEVRTMQNRQTRNADYKSQLTQLESQFRIDDNEDISWRASIVFSVLSELIDSLSRNIILNLMQVCSIVGQRTIKRPCARVVYNIYTSWRLTRTFEPLHRGRKRESIFDRYPLLRRKAYKWARRRMFKRKKDEVALTSSEFLKYVNAQFIRCGVCRFMYFCTSV